MLGTERKPQQKPGKRAYLIVSPLPRLRLRHPRTIMPPRPAIIVPPARPPPVLLARPPPMPPPPCAPSAPRAAPEPEPGPRWGSLALMGLEKETTSLPTPRCSVPSSWRRALRRGWGLKGRWVAGSGCEGGGGANRVRS